MNTITTRLGWNFAALVLVLAGCASPDMHVTRLAPGVAVSPKIAMKVYDVGDRVDRPYEIVGVVSASGQRAGVRSKARKQMLAEAAGLGAEALVGYYYDEEITVSTGDADGWAGALAVKFLPSGGPPTPPSKAVVALPHAVIGKDLGDGKKAEKANAIARKHARMLLAKKGYYAILTDDTLASGFPEVLQNLNAGDRLKYGSPDAGMVLAVTLGKRHAFNVLLAAGATQELGMALYSKATNAVTWSSAGNASSIDPTKIGDPDSGIGLASGVGHLFVPSAKTVQSVHAAMVRAFRTLPDLSQPTLLK